MTLLISIFTVLAGLAFGSFLNVCISRLPRHESIVSPRSHCPHCLRPIRSWDNIPVVSWITLGGRCRDCGRRISVRYLLIEVATAALFLLCLLEFSPTPHALAMAVLCWLLLGLAATDAETMLLPDALTLPGMILGVIFSAFRGNFDALSAQNRGFFDLFSLFQWQPAALSLFWAGCAAALILVIRGAYWLIRRREGIGLGDAKLLAMIAAWLGPKETALVLFLGVIGASVYGAVLIAARGALRQGAKSGATRIPFGSFLCAAAILTLFCGNSILHWYLGFF